MKVLGVVQFQQKRFKFLGFTGAWRATMGNVPDSFIGIIFGHSGNGKTEFCIQLAKYLTHFDKVVWLSYEQGHGADLQMAVNRNKMEEVAGLFHVADPLEKIKPGVTLFEDLDAYLSKRGTPRFVFVDSIDYTRFSFDQYQYLKKKYGKRKGIIFISHCKNKLPKSSIGNDILYDGQFGILVKNFIARPEKSRLGGFEPYIIWEEKARERDPLFFQQKVMQ